MLQDRFYVPGDKFKGEGENAFDSVKYLFYYLYEKLPKKCGYLVRRTMSGAQPARFGHIYCHLSVFVIDHHVHENALTNDRIPLQSFSRSVPRPQPTEGPPCHH